MKLDKQRLVNLTNPDSNINGLQNTNFKLHAAIKDLGTGSQQLINATFPPLPVQNYYGRVISGGIQIVGNDLLVHHYHVALPSDPSGYFKCLSITLNDCFITLKVPASGVALVADLKVSQLKGTTTFKSLFQPGFLPQLTATNKQAHNVKFAINTLYQDDIIRHDITQADGVASGLELVLVGTFNWTENA